MSYQATNKIGIIVSNNKFKTAEKQPDLTGTMTFPDGKEMEVSIFILFTVWGSLRIDPVSFCSGVIFEENTDEHEDGRRRQTLDGQAQSGVGHGDHSRQDLDFRG